jgi:hypothetical protein
VSDHDYLWSEAMKLKKQVEQYVEEYDPLNGFKALKLATELVMTIQRFTDDEARPL